MALGVWLTRFLQSLEKLNELQSNTCDASINTHNEKTCQSTDHKGVMTVQSITWTIFLLLTIIHVWANYIGVQRLRLRTLNYERARVALQPLIEECGRLVRTSTIKESDMKDRIQRCADQLPTPESVSESLWKSIVGMFYKDRIRLGIRVNDLMEISVLNSYNGSREVWNFLREEFRNEKYIIFVGGTSRHPTISVMMKLQTTSNDELKAFVHAHLLLRCMKQYRNSELYVPSTEQQLISRYA